MGQAKQRKQKLGDLYGTKQGSNSKPLISFRWMTDQEIDGEINGFRIRLPDDRLHYLAAEQADKLAWLIVLPVIDAAGQFNSRVTILYQPGSPRSWLQSDWSRHHRELNRFVFESFDFVISDQPDETD